MEERKPRKLAVILHADVVGSTALVQQDEAVAHECMRDAFRHLSDTIDAYGGTAHEIRGDAVVAEFARASDAVCAAVAFQVKNAEITASRDAGTHPVLRIGIAMGEVVIADSTITGEGVVIAQRLEQIAEAGGICVQGAAFETVPKRLPFDYHSLGEQTLKGFETPVRAYGVTLKYGEAVPTPDPGSRGEKETGVLRDKPSIAVLPFTNISSDPEQEYFSDGISEDIITDLSKISALFVTSRNSAFTYKNRVLKAQEVSRELGVRYVVEGSVRKAANCVRITAQLIDAVDDGHLWAERYDRDLSDIFALQDEIAAEIVSALKIRLTEDERERVTRHYTDNLEAYDNFLRGRDQVRATNETNAQARRLFEKAIDLDSDFAAAYAMLSYTHWRDWYNQWNDNPESLERAFDAARTAVALDDSLALARAYMAWAYLAKCDHEHAIAEGKRAIELDPNLSEGYARLGEILTMSGKPEQGVEMINQAIRLDPHYPPNYLIYLSHAHYAMGKYEDAVKMLQRCRIRVPNFLTPHRNLASLYWMSGREEEARVEVAEMLRISPRATVEGQKERIPFKDKTLSARFLEALRQAGLPTS